MVNPGPEGDLAESGIPESTFMPFPLPLELTAVVTAGAPTKIRI